MFKSCAKPQNHPNKCQQRVDTSQHIQYGSCAFLKKYAYIGNIDDGPAPGEPVGKCNEHLQGHVACLGEGLDKGAVVFPHVIPPGKLT